MVDKITLDKKTLGVLSSETRANILKSLDIRRMTVSELSRRLNLPKSTIYENLDRLVDTNLVKKNDDGRKRVYYELTEKGRRLLNPHEMTKIILLLSSAALSFIGGIIGIYCFIKSTFPEREEEVTGIVPLYEPKYLIFGMILLSLGVLFLYLAFRMRKNDYS
ncbi:ArsR family transcriptional regulator [Methanophagales archaeon]|nr:MAG: ArsR family transcriptional regulator [Methanophagales archaeon]RJS81529.1 MAG: ArsR family transcriptional regulator [Methanophagales archaeon]RLG31768.1 MAG: ArsR family transcriptional regulator [Methanosarcinales archaeon]